MNSRMNLFNEFLKTKKHSSTSFENLSKIKPFFMILIATILIGGLLLIKSKSKYSKQELALITELNSIKSELEQLETLNAQKVVEKDNSTVKKIRRDISGIDTSWVSVLWKFSALSNDKIVITEMELSRLGGERAIKIRGKATTFSSLKMWMQILIEHIPGAQFVIENQRFAADSSLPFEFEVFTKIL